MSPAELRQNHQFQKHRLRTVEEPKTWLKALTDAVFVQKIWKLLARNGSLILRFDRQRMKTNTLTLTCTISPTRTRNHVKNLHLSLTEDSTSLWSSDVNQSQKNHPEETMDNLPSWFLQQHLRLFSLKVKTHEVETWDCQQQKAMIRAAGGGAFRAKASEKKEPEKQTVSKLVHWEHWVNLNL